MNSVFEREIDIKRIFMELLYKAWVIILAGVIGGGVCYLYTSKCITPIYTASALMYVNNFSEDVQSKVVRVTNSDIDTSQALVQTYIAFLSSDQVLNGVADELEGKYTPQKLKNMMTATSVNDTELFKINISHPSPKEAEKIANVVADKAVAVISQYIDGSSIKVVDYATVPKSKSYPSTSRNTLIGFVAGAGIATIIILLLLLFNEKISNEDDLNSLFEEPVIGRIPDFNQVYGEGYLYRYSYGYGSKKAHNNNHNKR